jgi:hypothetical protein
MTRSSGATQGSPMQHRQAIDVRATDAVTLVTSIQRGLNEGANNRR